MLSRSPFGPIISVPERKSRRSPDESSALRHPNRLYSYVTFGRRGMSFDLESAAGLNAASREILDRLEAISGARHVIADVPGMERFLREPRDRFHGKALCVVQPGSTREIAEVLKLCHETSTPVVPQGGNTGLVGGQIPLGPGNQIVLSLGRMTALREIDLSSNTMTVEAGMILSRVQEEAARVGRLFPLSLAAGGPCAGSRAWTRSRARRWASSFRFIEAEKEQHGLRSKKSFHRLGRHAWDHHRGGPKTLSKTARDRDRFYLPCLAPGGARPARSRLRHGGRRNHHLRTDPAHRLGFCPRAF